MLIDHQIKITEERLKRLYKKKYENNIDQIVINTINTILQINIKSDIQDKEHVMGRSFYYNIMRTKTNLTLNKICAKLNNQKHTTAMYHISNFSTRYMLEKEFKTKYNKIICTI